MSVKSISTLGDLQLVSRHRLIDGISPYASTPTPTITTTKNEEQKPFVRDCGCVCRFTISSRKNPLRTAIRERKGSRFRGSLKSIQFNSNSKNRNNLDESTKSTSGTKEEMCTNDVIENQSEPISTLSKNSIKWYHSKYSFGYKTVPTSYRTTLIIPDSGENQTFKEEVQFKTKLYLERVIENVTINSYLPMYTSTLEININEHYLDLEPQQIIADVNGKHINGEQSILMNVDYGNSEC